MVKNTKGGNKGKKVARKNIIGSEITIKTRLANPAEPCEIYATVTRLFGQGFCEVLCSDGKYRTCIIRKKFSGRNKRGNVLGVDSKVLVGTRDWEVIKEGKKEKCDLLEVYDTKQHNDIKTDPRSNWKLLQSIEEKRIGIHQLNNKSEDYDDGIDFSETKPSSMGNIGNMKDVVNNSSLRGDDEESEDENETQQNIMLSRKINSLGLDKRYKNKETDKNSNKLQEQKKSQVETYLSNPTFDLEGDINWDDI
jgi:translation initiation factor IF-1